MDDKTAAGSGGELYLYGLMRTDLESLGVGKAIAHGIHAGNHLTWNHVVQPMMTGAVVRKDLLEWHRIGGGFGTTIALGDRAQIDIATLTAVIEAGRMLGHVGDLVVDDTYPYQVSREIVPLIQPDIHTMPPVYNASGAMCFRRETTMGYLFGDKSKLEVILKRFGLMPNDSLSTGTTRDRR